MRDVLFVRPGIESSVLIGAFLAATMSVVFPDSQNKMLAISGGLTLLWGQSTLASHWTRAEITLSIGTQTDLSGCDLSGTNLQGIYFARRDMCSAKLSNCDLDRADFSGALLRDARFAETQLERANFALSYASNANFYRAYAPNTRFEQATLIKASASEAVFDKAVFDNADMSAISFDRCSMKRASFLSANLGSADLTQADLSRSDLRGANLRGANLCGATLNGVKLDEVVNCEGAYIAGIKASDATIDVLRAGGAVASWPSDQARLASPSSTRGRGVDLRSHVGSVASSRASGRLVTAFLITVLVSVALSVPTTGGVATADESEQSQTAPAAAEETGTPAGEKVSGPNGFDNNANGQWFAVTGDGDSWEVRLFSPELGTFETPFAKHGDTYQLPDVEMPYYLQVVSADGSAVTCHIFGDEVESNTDSGLGQALCRVSPIR